MRLLEKVPFLVFFLFLALVPVIRMEQWDLFTRMLLNHLHRICRGYQIYHNYFRPHEALKGKTPAEACGIEIEGEDKWATVIQSAAAHEEKVGSL